MAFDTAVSGIKASSADLSIIGNNIANSSTAGFKASSAQFSDVFATSLLGSGANSIGKGVALANVHQEFAQGNITFTQNSLDLAINGAGFFMLSDEGASIYTRAGNFQVDKDGFIVNTSGKRLQGVQANSNGDLVGLVGDIQVDTALVSPQATQQVEIAANLDSREEVPVIPWAGPYDAFASPPTSPDPEMFNASTSVTVYDEQGVSHVMSTYFVKSSTANQWDAYTLIDGVSVGGPDTIPFQANGQIDPANLPLELNIVGWTPLNSSGTGTGASAQDFTIDLSRLTQVGASFAVSSADQDGYTAGQLRGVSIDSQGVVFARYTNGQSRTLAQVMMANFTSPSGLQPAGDTGWTETAESGQPLIGSAGNSGLGLIQSGALEESNVEITEQLVKMIVAQRNFQANAQVIQTEDAVTQTVINLR